MPSKGSHCSEETRMKMSIWQKGKPKPWTRDVGLANKGRVHSEETRRKMVAARTGLKRTPEQCKNISDALKGRKRPEISELMKKTQVGDGNNAWKGGVSFEPYCEKFNKEFRERVRAFFGYQCVECGALQNGKRHTVHHVNYDKMMCCNDVKPLFVSLCGSCNSKANGNRSYWQQHYTDIINNYYGGKCYLSREEMNLLEGV